MTSKVSLTRALAVFMMHSALVLSTGLPIAAQSVDTPQFAPVNPAFYRYLDGPVYGTQSLNPGERPSGLVPEIQDLSHLGNQSARTTMNILALPTSYDLRPLGKLTAVRNQGSCGSCWSFATMGSLESSLMPNVNFDGSENNLKNLAGFDLSCCSGGNRSMSAAYMARWAGAVSESADLYNQSSCTSPSGLPSAKHVQDIIFFPDRTGPLDNDTLKQAVMTYGAVYTSYYHNDSYYNSSTYGYYYNGSSQGNHAVCIVGWDDNYDKSKFRITPPGNGAFIIRNSWGSYWGQAGYFYISYYDTLMGLSNAMFIAEANPSYDSIYQYDPLGWITSSGYGGNTAWYGNVFTATSNTNIAAASTYFGANNSTYELYVYLNPTGGPTSSTGAAASTTGTVATAGYHTVALDNPVAVTAGQKFSVVIKVTTPRYTYPIPLERPYGGYAGAATASTGQSYMSSTGTSWTDVAASYSNTNVCLKAFGRSGGGTTPTAGALTVTPATALSASGNAGGPFSPSTQTYTLSNSGGSQISWTAGKTQSWVSLSSASGTLAAGASTTVTVSVNSAANSLAAGSYSDTVTFTHSTNGTGNTTRGVSLTVTAAPTPTAGAMSVSPATGLTSTGVVGGPFSPSSQAYTITNTGGSAITWSAGRAQSWVSISATGGTLNAGASTTVTASINANAAGLGAGSYSDVVTFTNSTNGTGNTSRSVSLTVTASTPVPPSTGYKVGPTTYNWIDPSAHRQLYMGDDTTAYGMALPFTFQFYGKSYTSLYVGSNGLLGFNGVGLSSPSNVYLPSSTGPNAAIYPYWDDLNPSRIGAAVKIGVVGAAPNRRVVVSWVNVPTYYSSYTLLTFQAVLCEGTNDIVFQYQNVAPGQMYGSGRSATVGIENETGTSARQYSCNTSSLSSGTAIRFTTGALTSGNPLVGGIIRRIW